MSDDVVTHIEKEIGALKQQGEEHMPGVESCN
jgi:hypothetical protein